MEEPMRYNYITRLGNWYERKVLEETRMKDYEEKKRLGQLGGDLQEKAEAKGLEEVRLSHCGDGVVHMGDYVMLHNMHTNGYLATSLHPHHPLLTITNNNIHNNNNNYCPAKYVFRFMPLQNNSCALGSTIVYGQQFRLQTMNQQYLQSLPLSPTRQAPKSKKQEVELSCLESGDNIWCIEDVNPATRFQSEKTGVKVKQPLLIKHMHTQQWLGSGLEHQVKQQEYEVYCHSHFSLNKTQNLIGETTGRTTTQHTLRSQGSNNTWSIVPGPHDQPRQDLHQYKHSQQLSHLLLSLANNIVNAKGLAGFRHFHLQLMQIPTIDLHNFKWLLLNYNISLSQQQLSSFMQQINDSYKDNNDNNNDNNNNNDEQMCTSPERLYQLLVPPLVDRRLVLVQEVYEQLCKQHSPLLFSHLATIYNPDQHPQVLTQQLTSEQAFHSFVNAFPNLTQSTPITLQAFTSYYQDISAAMDVDQHFEYMIKTAWNLN